MFSVTARPIVFSLLIATSQDSFAEVWKGTISKSIQLTDVANVQNEKTKLIQQIQVEASQRSGSLIVNREKLSKGAYSKTSELISASEVTMDNVKEDIVNNGRSRILTVTANCSIDMERVRSNLSIYRENRILRDAISDLTIQLMDKPVGGSEAQHAVALIPEYFSTASRSIPEQEIEAIQRNNDKQYSSIYLDIMSNVISKQLLSQGVHAEIDSIRGDKLSKTVNVRVSTHFDLDSARKTLSKYWRTEHYVDSNYDYILINGGVPLGKEFSEGVLNQVFDNLRTNQIALRVSINNKSVTIPLSYIADDFMPRCVVEEPFESSNVYCLSNVKSGSMRPFTGKNMKNPIALTFFGDEARDMQRIEIVTDLVWRKAPKNNELVE